MGLSEATKAYEIFDKTEDGLLKIVLDPTRQVRPHMKIPATLGSWYEELYFNCLECSEAFPHHPSYRQSPPE